MFCENCGKELGEDITVCAFCGTRQSATVIAASTGAAENSENSINTETTSVPMSAPVNASESAPIGAAVPTPNVIPSSGAINYPTVVIKSGKKQKSPRERKYTLGHLILCLAAAGVMAVTAGVFAGLYFSVV